MPRAEQLVDEPAIEVEARWLVAPLPSGTMRGHARENRYAWTPSSDIRATSSR